MLYKNKPYRIHFLTVNDDIILLQTAIKYLQGGEFN